MLDHHWWAEKATFTRDVAFTEEQRLAFVQRELDSIFLYARTNGICVKSEAISGDIDSVVKLIAVPEE